MMKKLLVMALVLGLAAVSSATVVEVQTVGLGDQGHAGTQEDPLAIGECIEIALVLNQNLYDGYPSYNGYMLSGIGVDLVVEGAGAFDYKSFTKGGDPIVNTNLSTFSFAGLQNGVHLEGVSLDGLSAGEGARQVFYNFIVCCTGEGPMTISLIDTATVGDDYAPYTSLSGGPFPDWQPLLQEDLGSLTLYNVPEPMTVGLLGLGGLFLRRRK